jgi:hypothetical protein
MTGDRFDKFAWIRTVFADSRIAKHAEKLALIHAALFYVIHGSDDTAFCVRQDTWGDRSGTSERTVRNAIKTGIALGYVVAGQPRKRGTGSHEADELRLAMPKLPAGCAGQSEELPARSAASDRHDSPELPAGRAGSFRKEGFLEGSLGEGTGPYPRTEAETNQPPTCSRHPNGPEHEQNCRQCQRWREWLLAEPQRVATARKRDALQRRAAIADCPLCDEYGMIELHGGVRKCRHRAETETCASA